MIAFLEQNIRVDEYVAYEYDTISSNTKKDRPYGWAAKLSKHNFPTIRHMGDVFNGDFTQYLNYDFLIGGSPCTYWSISRIVGREVLPQGNGWDLFEQFIRALNEAKPKYFIFENNKSMSPEVKNAISKSFGFEPIEINSSLLSGQNRERLYWVGKKQSNNTYTRVDIKQPEDRHILLKDVLSENTKPLCETVNNKSYCITSVYYKGNSVEHSFKKHSRTIVAEKVCQHIKDNLITKSVVDGKEYIPNIVEDGVLYIQDKKYNVDLEDGLWIVRLLSVSECARLQTIPDWYDFSVISNTQAYKIIGNAWTVSVIQYLINCVLGV